MNRIEFRSIVGAGFKWGENPPLWCSAFLSTNDRPQHIEHLDRLSNYITVARIPKHRLNLVSVIGGLFFLRLLERLDFGHIVLFDCNINEHAKLARVVNALINTDYADYDNLLGLDQEIRASPQDFYMPRGAGDLVKMQLATDSVFEYEGRSSSMETMLPPSVYPEFAWVPESRQSYEKVKRSLIENLDRNIYVTLPTMPIGQPGSLTIVYLSNIFHDKQTKLVPEYVKSQVASDHVIPLYCAARGKNDAILDAHMWWEVVVSGLMKGRTLQIWADEDASLVGTKYDRLFAGSTTLSRFVASGVLQDFDCLVSHILFGKNTDARAVGKRASQFKAMLKRARGQFQRIIIADFNSAGTSHAGNACLPTIDEITAMARDELRDYEYAGLWFSPGHLDSCRNFFIVFDRKAQS